MAKSSHSKAAPLAKPKMRWPLQDVPTQDLVIKRIAPALETENFETPADLARMKAA